MPVIRQKGTIIRTPVASALMIEEGEEEVLPEDLGLTRPAADVPIASLSKDEQMELDM